MISEEMLCKAAARSNALYVEHYEKNVPAQPHIFSPAFEKKIEKLKRKADHPLLYPALRRVASVLLAVLVLTSAWLAVDVKAREAFFGWVKEFYGNLFVYRYEGEVVQDAAPTEYELTWIPEGYTEFFVDDTLYPTIIYANEEGLFLKFQYARDFDDANWAVSTLDMECEQVMVNGQKADFLFSKNPDISSAIMWIAPDDTAFFIDGFFDESTLISLAESVQKK